VKKKGQIQQVFIYAMVLIVAALVVLIGYKAIGGFMKKGCDAGQKTFANDLEGYVKNYITYGSAKKEQLSVPCGYAKLCFADAGLINNKTDKITGNEKTISFDLNKPFSEEAKIIESSVNSGIKENVFLVKSDVADPIAFLEEIKIDIDTNGDGINENIICINATTGFFFIGFEGLGKQVKLSPARPKQST
jgi:hypothetical protein